MNISDWKRSFTRTACATLLLPTTVVFAQEHAHDHGDDPLLTRVIIDELEVRDAEDVNPMVLEAQAWVGKDRNKLWLKADVERADNATEESELQALYSRALAPYWDIQMGVRYDSLPTPSQSWGVLGVQGLAPYWFETDAAIFVGESGDLAARFSVEYELLFTQRLILSPSLEVNLYGQNMPDRHVGAGLSVIEGGLRLRYEIRREFAPYIGLNWSKKYGETADFAKLEGHAVEDSEWVIGLRAWF